MEDGSKRPRGQWARYMRERATEAQIRAWYEREGCTGLGYVTGAISGFIELLEFDDANVARAYRDLADKVGLGNLFRRIVAGYCEETPGGGWHLVYRVAGGYMEGNTKLAKRPTKLDEQGRVVEVKTLIETRNEGGYMVAAPSNGTVHPSGKRYNLVRGGVETIATITAAERESLWELARAFDEMPRQRDERESRLAGQGHGDGNGDRPGDVLAERLSWGEILEPWGWRLVFQRGKAAYWRRPGKDGGISASTDFRGSDYLYVFSTSTVFDHERGYSKFSVWGLLNYDSDYSVAAREARRLYGPRPTKGASTPHKGGGVKAQGSATAGESSAFPPCQQ